MNTDRVQELLKEATEIKKDADAIFLESKRLDILMQNKLKRMKEILQEVKNLWQK